MCLNAWSNFTHVCYYITRYHASRREPSHDWKMTTGKDCKGGACCSLSLFAVNQPTNPDQTPHTTCRMEGLSMFIRIIKVEAYLFSNFVYFVEGEGGDKEKYMQRIQQSDCSSFLREKVHQPPSLLSVHHSRGSYESSSHLPCPNSPSYCTPVLFYLG